jgi:hypothetical protein
LGLSIIPAHAHHLNACIEIISVPDEATTVTGVFSPERSRTADPEHRAFKLAHGGA